MAKTTTVLCDGCGSDLTRTGNSVDYRLALTNEAIPSAGGFVTDMMIYPSLRDGDKYFCGLGCLDHWRARVKHEDALWREFHESCVNERRGNMTSYRHVPDDERKAKKAEIKAAALEKFPMRS
jgi:hypothetical protein